MNLDKIALPALTHFADKVPADALPHLGSLAHIGLFLSGKPRRLFFKALNAIFGLQPEDHKKGMEILLELPLDYSVKCDAVRYANRLRKKMGGYIEREYIRKFFRALQRVRILREQFHLLDTYEGEGEDTEESIHEGKAFRPGGLVSRLLGENVRQAQEPAVKVKGQKKQLPTYDKDARELRVGDVVMRKYCKVNYHERILEAFQKTKWRKKDIPVPESFQSYPDRLRATIDQLNTPQKNKHMLIRFGLHERMPPNGLNPGSKAEKYIFWEWRN
jgi:hypothetical protein